jgi:deoxyribodipyrimidine photo-lyase
MTRPAVIWFRDDLRLADNPALQAAVAHGGPVVPLFVQDDAAQRDWPVGAAARWWLQQSLDGLDAALRQRGASLVRRQGDSLAELQTVVAECGAGAVYWNRRYTPAGIAQDTTVKAALRDAGIAAHSFKAGLLVEPMQVTGQVGSFSKFFERWQRLAELPEAMPAPARIAGIELASPPLRLLAADAPRWTPKLDGAWTVGEGAALARLARFLDEGLPRYGKGRHQLAADNVSHLSPHLHAGEISPAAILRALPERGSFAFIRQLAWREYGAFLLFREPALPERELMPERRCIAWRNGEAELRAWQRGETGYELVDAAMRQLWQTGWMHNRTRMVVASFLTKHLLIDWRQGQRWFWETLVDADLANNAMGWQWSASVGADARGIVRIFDPVGQAEKVDPEGAYRRSWLCEAARPAPIVAHDESRGRALAAYAAV